MILVELLAIGAVVLMIVGGILLAPNIALTIRLVVKVVISQLRSARRIIKGESDDRQ